MGILYALAKAQIVSFDLVADKKYVRIEERCDGYYKKHLNKAEMQHLVNELQTLTNQMEDLIR